MPKIKQGMQKQVNINCPDNDKEKVLKRLVPFFYNKNEYMVNNNVQVLAITMYGEVSMPRNSTCFKQKIEHENLHRNKAKNKVLEP
jgi:hypothetical protein